MFGYIRKFFSSPKDPDWLWGPVNFLFSEYQALSPRECSRPGIKLTTHLPRSRMTVAIFLFPLMPSWHAQRQLNCTYILHRHSVCDVCKWLTLHSQSHAIQTFGSQAFRICKRGLCLLSRCYSSWKHQVSYNAQKMCIQKAKHKNR